MSAFRWTRFSLFLTLLHLTAVTGDLASFTVRDGDEFTLPCENVIRDQYKCNSTSWRFMYFKTAAVELVVLGRIGEDVKGISDRLSVTESCSLVIKKVTAEDTGHYSCRQVKSGKYQDSHAFLFVANMTEQKNDDKVTLNCSVSTYGSCRHTVKWLYEGKDVEDEDMETSQSECSANVTFPTSHLKRKSSDRELFKCHVRDHYTGGVQQFTFTPQSSGEDATTAAPPTTTQEGCSAVNYIMLVLRVAELVLITVITVLLVRARGNQRPPDNNTAHHDGDGRDVTVSYRNASASVNSPRK